MTLNTHVTIQNVREANRKLIEQGSSIGNHYVGQLRIQTKSGFKIISDEEIRIAFRKARLSYEEKYH